MPVTVDHAPLETDELGLCTVGQVLSHVRKGNRLITNVLIDGQEPDLRRLEEIRRAPLNGKVVYIETSDPRQIALDVLDEVGTQLSQADKLKSQAAESLQKNQNAKAMEDLARCFSAWQNAQKSVTSVARLRKIDLDKIQAEGKSLNKLLSDFTGQLHQIKASLESRDFVTLSDLLLYETSEMNSAWMAALRELRREIE